MSGTCKVCRWWDEDDFRYGGYGECGLASNAWFLPPDTKVVVMAGDAPQRLVTAADFGCNQFEQ